MGSGAVGGWTVETRSGGVLDMFWIIAGIVFGFAFVGFFFTYHPCCPGVNCQAVCGCFFAPQMQVEVSGITNGARTAPNVCSKSCADRDAEMAVSCAGLNTTYIIDLVNISDNFCYVWTNDAACAGYHAAFLRFQKSGADNLLQVQLYRGLSVFGCSCPTWFATFRKNYGSAAPNCATIPGDVIPIQGQGGGGTMPDDCCDASAATVTVTSL